jgi:hypothetical protein
MNKIPKSKAGKAALLSSILRGELTIADLNETEKFLITMTLGDGTLPADWKSDPKTTYVTLNIQ